MRTIYKLDYTVCIREANKELKQCALFSGGVQVFDSRASALAYANKLKAEKHVTKMRLITYEVLIDEC